MRSQSGHSGAAPRLACYGKLPFYIEYLRVNMDSPIGRWLVRWLDDAQIAGEVLAADREIRAIIALPGGDAAAILIRPSRDSYPRNFPIAIAASFPAAALAGRWYLAPLYCAPQWSHMGRGVIDAPTPAIEAFAAVLAAASHPFDDAEFSAQRFASVTGAALKRPWTTLCGRDGEAAVSAARSVGAFCDSRRAGAADSAVVLPNAACAAARLRGDPCLATATWLRLLDALRGGDEARPAVVETWRQGATHWDELYVFARPVEGGDLAALLGGGRPAGVADLDRVAPAAPELSPAAQSALAKLTAAEASCLAALWS